MIAWIFLTELKKGLKMTEENIDIIIIAAAVVAVIWTVFLP